MEYIDTHCHLQSILPRMGCASFTEFAGAHLPPEFGGCITIACDRGAVEPVEALAREDKVFAAFGIHPHDAKHYGDDLEASLERAVAGPKAVAWGEIGLDYHYNFSEPGIQRRVFRRQIGKGVAAGRPLIIHTREAEDDTLAILREEMPRDWKVHVHCFTSSAALAEALLETFPNLYLGFTGVITFRNATAIQDVVRRVPLERLLLETDGPYMAPVPFRGKVAHPGHIPFVAAKMAELKEVDREPLYRQVRENTRKVYGI